MSEKKTQFSDTKAPHFARESYLKSRAVCFSLAEIKSQILTTN